MRSPPGNVGVKGVELSLVAFVEGIVLPGDDGDEAGAVTLAPGIVLFADGDVVL